MGEALIRGLIGSGAVSPGQVVASEPRANQRERVATQYGAAVTSENTAAVAGADVVVLCVKPQILDRVLDEIGSALGRDATVISIAAGKDLAHIEGRLPPGTRVVRAMPNVACLVGAGATGLAGGANATEKDLDLARRIFDSVGMSVLLEETLIDAVTGLSGSGPAYVFLFAEALLSGALKVGLPAAEARALAVQTIKGAAAMLEADPSVHPAVLRDAVTTPGGTTIAGLHELESRGFRDGVIRAIEAATEKSRLLGKGSAGKN
jgi:pyrroline-5-carboxylate reductase